MILATALATIGLLGFQAAPSFAASRDGVCQAGEFCYYYNSGQAGSVSDFTGSISNYGTDKATCYVYKGPGNGKDRCIKNDAASVWNRSNQTVRVYYNSNYGGAYQDFAPGAKGNLNATLKNENASHQFRGTPGPTPAPSSNTAASTSITAKLDKLIAGTASLHYSGSTHQAKNGTKWDDWKGSVWGWQCKGFATAVFYELYGYNISPSYQSSNRHVLNISSSKTSVVYSAYRPSKSTLITKLQTAKPGDYIQMSKASSQHSLIVYAVVSNGVWVYDANSDGANTIKKQLRSWDYFYDYMGSSGFGISIYRAK